MSLKPVINVKCPCCKRILEVNVEEERVVAHRKGAHLKEDAHEGEDTLDVALRQTRERHDEAEDQFLKAQDSVKHSAEHLEDLFKDAKKRATEQQEDDDPDNPFSSGKVWD